MTQQEPKLLSEESIKWIVKLEISPISSNEYPQFATEASYISEVIEQLQ